MKKMNLKRYLSIGVAFILGLLTNIAARLILPLFLSQVMEGQLLPFTGIFATLLQLGVSVVSVLIAVRLFWKED